MRHLLFSAAVFAKPNETGTKAPDAPHDKETGEVVNLPSTIDNDTGASISERATAHLPVGLGIAGHKLVIGGREITIAKQVTIPVLRQEDMKLFAVRFEEAIHEGEEMKNSRGGGAKMAPARLARVTNLETGMLNQLIVNTVLEAELRRCYADDTYVGKYIAFQRYENEAKGENAPRYKRYDILELNPADFDAVAA